MMFLLDLRTLLCWISVLLLLLTMLLVCLILLVGFGGLLDAYGFLLATTLFFGGSTNGLGGYTKVGFIYSSSYTTFSSLTGRCTFYSRTGSLIGAIV